MKGYLILQFGRLCLNIGPGGAGRPRNWRFFRYNSGWCLFAWPFGSIAWWRFMSGFRIGVQG